MRDHQAFWLTLVRLVRSCGMFSNDAPPSWRHRLPEEQINQIKRLISSGMSDKHIAATSCVEIEFVVEMRQAIFDHLASTLANASI